ncbi:MAG TPA: TspO/MBR family protein [Acidisphaera sp.]|nr:TspO/MBR family protein [Acidisphaera sp.]
MTIAIAGLAAILVAGLGGMLTDIGPWYKALRKPSWQPPDWLFGPAWSVIFTCTAAAGVLAWRAAPNAAAETRIILLFAVNGILNIAWSPLFFRLRRPDWALIEIIPFWLSILALVVALTPISATAGWLLLPYLLWVSFAAVLNLAIVRLNPAFGRAAAGSRPVR